MIIHNFKLIHNDALKVDFNEIIGDEKSVKLVANLTLLCYNSNNC